MLRPFFILLLLYLIASLGCQEDSQAMPDSGMTGADASSDVSEPVDVVDAADDADAPWRSSLYPEDWEPRREADQGRFLHDFSYAGYRNGAKIVDRQIPVHVVDVLDFGADPTGENDSTEGIQEAIDAAEDSGGAVVSLPAGEYRVDGKLLVSESNIVLRGAGPEATKLYFTRHEGMSYGAHLTFRGDVETIEEIPLAEDLENRNLWIALEDASDLKPGEDIDIGWIITDEFVEEHQMSGVWQAFNGQWQTFFRRQIVEVDVDTAPHRVRLDVPARYPALLRDHAAVRRADGYLQEVGVESISVANAVDWDDAWDEMQVHLLEFHGVKDGWVYDVASYRPPTDGGVEDGGDFHLQSSGILVSGSKRITISDVVLERAQNRGPGGCGYLFEIRSSSEILTRDSVGRGGRHNFIQNWGFGTTGSVWLRVKSEGGRAYRDKTSSFSSIGLSDFHHSLATANLIDSSVLNDGWSAVNRQSYSSGAGHSATQNVFWNTTGGGTLRSFQYQWGYIIGTGPDLEVHTEIPDGLEEIENPGNLGYWQHAEPADWTEGPGRGSTLRPQSLYEDQLSRRLD